MTFRTALRAGTAFLVLTAASLSATAALAQNSPMANENPNAPSQGGKGAQGAGQEQQSSQSSQASGAASSPTTADFLNAGQDASNWILPAKSYSGNRYTTIGGITPDNVAHLKHAWTFQVSDDGPMEVAPIIWHGTMYVTSAHDHVYALDAATGKQKWEFEDSPHVISFAANRGVGLMDGNVYIATLDGHLIALNADTGKKVWDIVGVHDTKNSFYTMSPVPYHNPSTNQDMLLLGVSDGDWGGRGYITAFDPKDGHRIWEWITVPGPGEAGNDTWGKGDAWKRGGASVWSGVAIDPNSQTLYLDLGNPQPDFLGTTRPGKNLYSDSMVALDISGEPKLKWYYQFISHDTHDWDPAMPPVLFYGKVNGQERPLVAAGDKGGNFWVLDSENGHLVDHTVVSFQHGQNTDPTLSGNVACPNTNGGVEYNGGAYDPATNTFYVPSVNECGFWRSTQQAMYINGQFYLGGVFPTFVGPNTGDFSAIDISTGVFNWRHHYGLPAAGGALVLQSGLVFTGQLNGQFDAYDAKSGADLWHVDTGNTIIAPPVAYEAGGKSFIAVASGEAGNQKVPELKLRTGAMINAYSPE